MSEEEKAKPHRIDSPQTKKIFSDGSGEMRFFMQTQVDQYLISTVGDMHYNDVSLFGPNPQPIGCDRLYETMVFITNEEGERKDIDFMPYNDEETARAGHEYMVTKYINSTKENV